MITLQWFYWALSLLDQVFVKWFGILTWIWVKSYGVSTQTSLEELLQSTV